MIIKLNIVCAGTSFKVILLLGSWVATKIVFGDERRAAANLIVSKISVSENGGFSRFGTVLRKGHKVLELERFPAAATGAVTVPMGAPWVVRDIQDPLCRVHISVSPSSRRTDLSEMRSVVCHSSGSSSASSRAAIAARFTENSCR